MLIVVALTAVGVALRLAVAQQSLFADELSTRFIVAGHGLADVVSVVHTDAEITPPLFFVLAWLTTRPGLTAELLRAPSLIAGAAAIPLVYLLGVRTVGRRAALVGAALTTFSPFMVFFSAQARSYELMIVLVLGSTLCLLTAVEQRAYPLVGRIRRSAACAAAYTHYTCVFALAGQLGWLLWAHPEARRAAVTASAAAAVGFLPWLSGLQGDLQSPTTDILSALQPFDPQLHPGERRPLGDRAPRPQPPHPYRPAPGRRRRGGVPARARRGARRLRRGGGARAPASRPRGRAGRSCSPPRYPSERRSRARWAPTCSAPGTSRRRGRRSRSAWPRCSSPPGPASAPPPPGWPSPRSPWAARRCSIPTSGGPTTTGRSPSSTTPRRPAMSSSTA